MIVTHQEFFFRSKQIDLVGSVSDFRVTHFLYLFSIVFIKNNIKSNFFMSFSYFYSSPFISYNFVKFVFIYMSFVIFTYIQVSVIICQVIFLIW